LGLGQRLAQQPEQRLVPQPEQRLVPQPEQRLVPQPEQRLVPQPVFHHHKQPERGRSTPAVLRLLHCAAKRTISTYLSGSFRVRLRDSAGCVSLRMSGRAICACTALLVRYYLNEYAANTGVQQIRWPH
jgi:hypothetical protein